MFGTEWTDRERVEAWPSFREQLPHAPEAEALLVEHLLPAEVGRRRKGALFGEVFERLAGGGAFYDLDCVASPTEGLHALSQAGFWKWLELCLVGGSKRV
jgi:hypothetical protein